ncbi:MAG TPA: hypothetical protein VFF33_05785 [Ignavibacteriaceae bacterium]|nr:hypothetical protein [Ignavibacteriaceae bacterium]
MALIHAQTHSGFEIKESEPVSYNKRIVNIKNLLTLTYVIIPIAAGVDKFLNLLTNWTKYLSPFVTNNIPISQNVFMMIVGVIEITAGFIVALKPKIGAYVVMAWLIAIALQLLFSGMYMDVAVRDLGLAVGAYARARLNGYKYTND